MLELDVGGSAEERMFVVSCVLRACVVCHVLCALHLCVVYQVRCVHVSYVACVCSVCVCACAFTLITEEVKGVLGDSIQINKGLGTHRQVSVHEFF